MHTFIELLQKLYHFDDLIRWGGHFILIAIIFAETGVMAGFFLPGDSLLVTAGLFAARGTLNIWLLLGELCLAAILGDSLSYAIGRRLGPALFSRGDSFFFRKKHLQRTRTFYQKHGARTIVLARFVPVIRTFAPVVAGIGEMNYRAFVTYNVWGGIGWVLLMVLGGYSLGRIVPSIDKNIHKVILMVIFISLLPALVEWWKERRAGVIPAATK